MTNTTKQCVTVLSFVGNGGILLCCVYANSVALFPEALFSPYIARLLIPIKYSTGLVWYCS